MHKARTEDRTKDGEEEKWSSGSSDNRDQVDQLHIAEQQKSWTRDNVEQDDQADQVDQPIKLIKSKEWSS